MVVADVWEEEGRAVVAEVGAAGGEARFVRCDVRREADAAGAVAAAVEGWGGLDVLVNNAAHFGPDRPVGETGLGEWEETLAVTLTGVFVMSKHALVPMVAAGRGTIVNVASTAGLVAYRNHAAYIAAKGGVLALTRSLAVDYGGHNIRVNAVCPATVRTPHTEPIYAEPERLARMLAKQALLAILTPDDVARAVAYLASDDSAPMTGACLVVDAGLTAG
jgi:NAD(P)-dependent dehydrogenase (short-subunit alcohol dehydrogenase family)